MPTIKKIEATLVYSDRLIPKFHWKEMMIRKDKLIHATLLTSLLKNLKTPMH